MTFQQTTTYEQALELERRGFYRVAGLRARSEDRVIQYVTRQQLEDFLMERYVVDWYQSIFEGQHAWYVHLFPRDVREYPVTGDSELYLGHAVGDDPFPAIFDAVVWSLEQEKANQKAQ